jgi:predicted RNase H-like HicB family nuclease
MNFDVILQKKAKDGFVARPVLWPESVAYGATEQEALAAVSDLIRELFNQAQLVQVEVDIPSSQRNNPWLAKAGIFANDPTWADFLQAMNDYRQQLDDEHTSDPS